MNCRPKNEGRARLCEELDERVHAFLERPIEGDWPYLWIGATYVKTREAGRIVSVAVIGASCGCAHRVRPLRMTKECDSIQVTP